MKIFFTLIALLFSMFSLYAQPNETLRRGNSYQGKLSISSITSEPLKITVDGSNYMNKGKDGEIQITDVKPGYHAIKVFTQKKNKNNRAKFKSTQLVYEGNVYVRSQYHVDIVINRFGKAFIDEKQMNAEYYDENDTGWDGGWNNQDNHDLQTMSSRSFDQFKQVIRNESFDNTKLVVAKQTISSNYFSSAQVKEIVQLLSFENSKLEIAKYSYKNTVDKNNYFMINDAFAYSSSKEELARFIQAYR